MLELLQQRSALLNLEYLQHKEDLDYLEERLTHDLDSFDWTLDDRVYAKDYIKDRVTLFRYLYTQNFDVQKAHEELLETVKWRQKHGIGQMTYQSVAREFFEDGFAFFHKQDRLGRPVAVVRLRYFPQFRDKSVTLTDQMRPYTCLVLEMVRKIMLDITRENERSGIHSPLVSQMAVIIDIGKAPYIPIDASLVKALMEIMDKRFPGTMGSIYVMNFGWMYQGLWQMVKYIISEEARSRISFPSAKEVLEVIHREDLLKELGGLDDYQWSIETDDMLQRYGTGRTLPSDDKADSEITNSTVEVSDGDVITLNLNDIHITSTRQSRSSSIVSDEYFDASDVFFQTPSTYSEYGTPGFMTPPTEPIPHQAPGYCYAVISANKTNSNSSIHYWTGLHMGAAFLTSFLGGIQHTNRQQQDATYLLGVAQTQLSMGVNGVLLADRLANLQHQEQIDNNRYILLDGHEVDVEFQRHTPHFPHLLPPDDPQSAYALSPVRVQLQRIEYRLVRWTRRVFRLTFAYKGAIYWVILYIFLRGPVENVLRRSLAAMFTSSAPQKVTYTTIGITAAVAAAIGTSLTSRLGLPRSN
ncbi:CRAL-TRIO domain-containing protein [Dichotomocladium elegans]|nr:CRAL-TRIO domain-containing protein [Dichotomocladium elegans]